jgi:hypothetical protein
MPRIFLGHSKGLGCNFGQFIDPRFRQIIIWRMRNLPILSVGISLFHLTLWHPLVYGGPNDCRTPNIAQPLSAQNRAIIDGLPIGTSSVVGLSSPLGQGSAVRIGKCLLLTNRHVAQIVVDQPGSTLFKGGSTTPLKVTEVILPPTAGANDKLDEKLHLMGERYVSESTQVKMRALKQLNQQYEKQVGDPALARQMLVKGKAVRDLVVKEAEDAATELLFGPSGENRQGHRSVYYEQ